MRFEFFEVVGDEGGMGGEAEGFGAVALDELFGGAVFQGGDEGFAEAAEGLFGAGGGEVALPYESAAVGGIAFGDAAVAALEELRHEAEEEGERGITQSHLGAADADDVGGSLFDFAGDLDGEAALELVARHSLPPGHRETQTGQV